MVDVNWVCLATDRNVGRASLKMIMCRRLCKRQVSAWLMVEQLLVYLCVCLCWGGGVREMSVTLKVCCEVNL